MPDLADLGISAANIFHNLSYDEIFEHEVKNNEGTVTANGTFAVDTGKYTGRCPNDKYIVKQPPSENHLWWGPVNAPVSLEIFNELKQKVTAHLSGKDLYVFDGYCGANDNSKMNVRMVTELAWQHHFCTNMFIRPEETPGEDFVPDFTILNACKVVNDKWQEHGMNSEVFIIFDLEDKLALIGGTWYGGEMKKGIFSIMNYYLPLRNILAMHCSANMSSDGDTCLYFGLSGTGKTTLSTDPNRALIGDDEHGWDKDGVFNFEGGCYAKTIDLNPETEPDIYAAIKRDALLENVGIDPESKEVDFSDTSKTQNTRVSYPLHHIENIVKPRSVGNHPSNAIFLTFDAFGVLPPVARLNKGQAMYYFLSGYTAKVAGTEQGVTEPQATFSPCFGGPFLTLHPTAYAKLLGEKLDKHGTHVWLVNTGWVGGPYGVGARMKLPETRAIIDAIHAGRLKDRDFEQAAVFGFDIPLMVQGVDSSVLNPAKAWDDSEAYMKAARKLGQMFIDNFEHYIEENPDFDFHLYGPQL